MAMDLWDRAHEYNLTTINDEFSGRNYAWLDGYTAAIADAAAVARAHAFVEESADDTMQGIRRGEPYRKLAAAIESLVKPAPSPTGTD